MAEVRLFRIEERELSYLKYEQIKTLLEALAADESPDTAVIAKICLATGARWSEAEKLKGRQVRQGLLHYNKTKSGKSRSVPLDDALYQELEKRVEKVGSDRLFASCYEDFRRGVERAWSCQRVS